MRAKPFVRIAQFHAPVPTSRFRAWIGQYGISRLARSLVCSVPTIQNWKRGGIPHLAMAQKIILISREEPLIEHGEGVSLTYDDCFGVIGGERSNVPEKRT